MRSNRVVNTIVIACGAAVTWLLWPAKPTPKKTTAAVRSYSPPALTPIPTMPAEEEQVPESVITPEVMALFRQSGIPTADSLIRDYELNLPEAQAVQLQDLLDRHMQDVHANQRGEQTNPADAVVVLQLISDLVGADKFSQFPPLSRSSGRGGRGFGGSP